MFLPVQIKIGTSTGGAAAYDRMLETTSRFDALAKEAENMTVPLTRIGEDLHANLLAAFATEGATGYSGRWAPLSTTYGAWKAKHSSAPLLVGLKPLHKGSRQHPTRPESYGISGRMRQQLLMPLADRATWHIDPKRLAYTPLSNIAGFHQTGTSKMPARPPVDLSPAFLHSIDRSFTVWVAGLIEKAGL